MSHPLDPLLGGTSPGKMSSSSSASFKTPVRSPGDGPQDEDDQHLYRKKLPVPQPDKNSVNLWSYLKNCVGKELHKITMPVQWNEPISLLQRISEYMNYSYLLSQANRESETEKRLIYVATFAVSALAANFQRMGKPFNPLLGETYELKRKNFRILCEQVGHHPPVSAFHAEGLGANFVFRGSMYPKMKFWGKSVEFQPKGTLSVDIPEFEETYTWSNVNCIVHNVIVGTLWMEHIGTMEIVNRKTNHKAVLNFKPGPSGGWFSSSTNAAADLHTVEGFVIDHVGRKVRFLYGKWTEFLCSCSVEDLVHHLGVKDIDADLPKHGTLELGTVPNSETLWKADSRPEHSGSYYNFSQFTMGLNQILPIEENLCQTDCRNRPDIRCLEEGDLDGARYEKERLENKQREYRKPFKNKKTESDWWNPTWFIPVKNEFSKEDDWKYVGNYWESKSKGTFHDVPDIF